MKKVWVKNAEHVESEKRFETLHKVIFAEGNELEVSDGYHTFDELYDHRITLFIALAARIRMQSLGTDAAEGHSRVWRSMLHSDGTMFEGEFIMGIGKEKGEQITYHIPVDRWEETGFAETLVNAPEWDGHTPADVLTRLKGV